jgi:glycosyltransferase involved in cell wall biosynthesis
MLIKKVLLIAYYFPPRPGSGSVRPMGLAKYLPNFGWEPLIMTVRLPGPVPKGVEVVETDYVDILGNFKGWLGFKQHLTLKKQLGIPVGKHGATRPLLSRVISRMRSVIAFPDKEVGWVKFAVQEGKRLLAKEDIEAIISTSPPVTAHLIARKLKAISGKPWIADLRDPWTQNHYKHYGVFRNFIERKLEIRTLSQSDALVTAHPFLVDRLKELKENKRICWIPNGFDPDSFPKKQLQEKNHKFIMTYTGHLRRGTRDPELLLQTVSELITSGELKRTQIEVRFLGPFESWLLGYVEKYNLQDVVKIEGPVPMGEALRQQVESSLLLILTWDNPQEAHIYPGKVFEYLGAKRPILAIGGPGGVVKELLQKTQAGVHVSSLPDLRKVLLEYYRTYQTHGTIPYHAVEEEVRKYTQEAMADRFAQVLNEITDSKRN